MRGITFINHCLSHVSKADPYSQGDEKRCVRQQKTQTKNSFLVTFFEHAFAYNRNCRQE